MSLYAYRAAVVAAVDKLDMFSTGALGNLWKFVSATFRTTVRYKILNTVLGFGCKNHCLYINDITILQAVMKAVYSIFTVIFIHKVSVIVISLQVMSGQLCQTQTSVCSLFVSADLIVIGTVVYDTVRNVCRL